MPHLISASLAIGRANHHLTNREHSPKSGLHTIDHSNEPDTGLATAVDHHDGTFRFDERSNFLVAIATFAEGARIGRRAGALIAEKNTQKKRV